MSSSAKYTTLAAWPLAICRALEARGIDPTALLKDAELDHQQFRDRPDDRVDIKKMTRFWNSVEVATQDCAFGLNVAKFVQPMNFRALGLLMVTTDNLETALNKVEQYYSLVSNSVSVRTIYKADLIGFVIDLIPNVSISELAIDSFFASLFNFAQLPNEANQFIEKVELLRCKPIDPQPWNECFQAPIEFSAQKNCMWLRRDALKKASIAGDQKMATFNESVVQEYVQNLNSQGWREKVYKNILKQLDISEPTLNEVAIQLNTGERTLRRHLLDEQTSFRQLLQNARMEMAHHYLLKSELSITDIALRLSFNDASNFSRAFQRWYKMSPTQYRLQAADK